MTSTMKAIRFHDYGEPHVMRLETVPLPELRERDVLVRVYAAGTNPVDSKIRAGGLRGMFPVNLPLVPGWDFSGVVERAPDGIGVRAGDAVFGKGDMTRDGAYAEFIAVDIDNITKKPASLDHVQAAAIPTAALTAWQALFDAKPSINLQRGQSLLIQGGAGGVGSFAIQMAKARNATVYVTARGDNKKFLEDLGADVVIDYENERFEDRVKDVDAVLDLVGGEVEERSFDVIRPGGVLASTVRPPPDEVVKSHDVMAFTVGQRFSKEQLDQIGRLIDDRVLRVPVAEVMPLADAVRAHEILSSHHARGKIVLRVV